MSDKEKDLLRETIKKQTEEFIRKGGKIKKIKPGDTGYKGLRIHPDKKLTRQHRGKNRKEPTST
jgi:hypothetical protein